MSLVDLLYGLPLLGALIVALRRKHHKQAQTLAMVVFLVTAVITPVVVLLAPPGVLSAGIILVALAAAAIANLALGIHLLRAFRLGFPRPPSFYALILVLTGGVNAAAVAQTALILFGAWGLIVFAVVKLLWYGDVIRDVTADQEERLKRDREDFYNL